MLYDGGALTSCACQNRWTNKVTLCAADAARSRAPDGANRCKSHEAKYQRRLKSLECPNVGCPYLGMTAFTSDDARANSARFRSIPGRVLGAVCMFCHLDGWDETSKPELVDRHGVFVEGSASNYEGNPTRSRDLCLRPSHFFF